MAEIRKMEAAAATIHLLTKRFKPACGFSKFGPGAWPPGHLWAKLERAEVVNCPGCRRIASEILEERAAELARIQRPDS
jgi:hypothetical protein